MAQGNELFEGMLCNPPNRYNLFRNVLIACLFVLHELETHPPTHILSLATENNTLHAIDSDNVISVLAMHDGLRDRVKKKESLHDRIRCVMIFMIA